MDKKDTVDVPSIQYVEMSQRWDLIHALLGGTQAMRDKSTKYLPKEQAEDTDAYQRRLNRSYLFEAYSDTIDKIVSKPFSRAITTKGVPENLKILENDVDQQETGLTQFGRDLLDSLANYGLTHVLVDHTIVQANTDGVATIAQEKEAGARPIFVHIRPPNLIGWRFRKNEQNQPVLTQIRFKEEVIEPKPETMFLDWIVHYIRVYTEIGFQVWRKTKDMDEYSLVDESVHSFGSVPLVTVYVNRQGFMTATPPLEPLAWTNLTHWQSESDQRNILRFSRFGILFASGFSAEEVEKGIVVGPTNMFVSTNESAKLGYVEHTGSAIKAGERDLDTLEERMEVLGSQPFIRRTASSTATGKSIDEARNQTFIQSWVRELEHGLVTMFEFAAHWKNEVLPEDFSIDIFSDFKVTLHSNEDSKLLLQSCISNKLSLETYLSEIKRRGLLAENVDPAEEGEKIAEQGIQLGLIGIDDNDDNDDSND